MKRSTAPGSAIGAPREAQTRRRLLDRERLVDQLVAAGHLLGEVLVGRLLGEIEPGVELLLAHARDLDARLLEGIDELLIEPLGSIEEVVLGLLAGIQQRLLLLGR